MSICGTGDVDLAYCTKTELRCPINDVYISNSTNPVLTGYSSATLDSGQTLAFGTNQNDLPILRLKLTEGQVCAVADEYMKSPGRTLYKLLDYNGYGDCDTKVGSYYNDPRYTQISTVTENRLFNDNGITGIIGTLPYYPMDDLTKYSWNLYYGRIFKWSTECETKFNMNRKDMTSLLESCNNISYYQNALYYCCLVMMILCIILVLIGSICLCINEKSPRFVFSIVANSLILIILVISIIFVIISLARAYSCEGEFNKIKATNCSSEFTNQMLENYANSQLDSRALNWILLSFMLTLLVLRAVSFIFDFGVKRDYIQI